MPLRPVANCSKPRCPNKVYRSGKCEEHYFKDRRTSDKNRKQNPNRGGGARWESFSKAYLRVHARCECPDCLEQPYWNRPVSTEVDHIDGCGRNGLRAYDPTNLRAMSHEHHSQRTAKDQPGGWHKTLIERQNAKQNRFD